MNIAKSWRSGMALIWLVIVMGNTNMAHSQQKAEEYVAPAQAAPQGSAPNMQVQLLTRGEQSREYAVILGDGDEALSGLQRFAEEYHIVSAHFTAIGAVNGATVGWFDLSRKEYKKIPITGQSEVLSLIGDIGVYQGKPVVHAHIVVAGADGIARGGHLLEAHVSPTLEVMVTVDLVPLRKRLDPRTSLTLIDPGLK